MQKFLVVGCGGSGGTTLAYMMDQLKSDLADHKIDKIPAGWQFVSVDVPLVSEPLDGVARVEDQGGTYISTGPPGGGGYTVLDTALNQRILNSGSLNTVATWQPRSPEMVRIPLGRGAGQYRALGRAITLSQIDKLNSELGRAWTRLMAGDTNTEMHSLSIPGAGAFQQSADPIVLVVSSMAGGAGASMALDVCRILSMIPGLDPALMGVFMATPDIFRSIPSSLIAGVPGNALSMLGEIVASQTGAAREHDVELLRALGLDKGAGAEIPFARVFPVGGTIGADNAPFGNGTPDAVYRGLARGLVALMLSEKATKQFAAWDLTNTQGINFKRDALGWGAQQSDKLAWGAFGFASLSTGRDRYKEYAAQRLAHSAAYHLMYAHRDGNSSSSDGERVKAIVDNQFPTVCNRLGLPQAGERTVEQWLYTVVLPMAAGQQLAAKVVDGNVAQMPNGVGVAVSQWSQEVDSRLAQSRGALQSAAQQAALLEAFRWQNTFVTRLEGTVTAALAERGMPYATAILKRVRQQLEQVVAKDGEKLLAFAPGGRIADMPEESRRGLAAIRGVLANAAEQLRGVMSGVSANVLKEIYAHLASNIARAAAAMTTELIDPLISALDREQRYLRECENTPPTDTGLAYLRTDEYSAWPSEQDVQVSKRFAEAHNEVMLTSSGQFKALYEVHLPEAVHVQGVGSLEALRAGIGIAVGHVITGYWETTSGYRSPAQDQPVVQRTTAWRSSAFAVNPETNQATPPQSADYAVHVRPAEILERARKFVARPGEAFDRFCAVSLRDYVGGTDGSDMSNEPERLGRERDISVKFAQALGLARPLVAVNDEAVMAVNGVPTEYRYKFSSIPFAGLPIAAGLERVLNDQLNVDEATKLAFPETIVIEPGIKRIDIFGSYPNYSPLSYTAVIEPAITAWQRAGELEKKSFWTWRRSRPLTAALPMHEEERRAMVGGWLLGQALGLIRVPDEPYEQAVAVYDVTERSWVDFPNPLLTPHSEFEADYDILPAVLESVLIAIARSHQQPVMASMRPYQTLRRIYDTTTQDPIKGSYTLAASTNLTEFLRKGDMGSGLRSVVPDTGPGVDIEQRARLIQGYFEQLRDFSGQHFLTPGEGGGQGLIGAVGGGAFSRIDSRARASRTPIFRDVAPDVFVMAQKLVGFLPQCVEEAKRPAVTHNKPSTPVGEGPEDIEIPQMPGFGGAPGSRI